jgi:DUF1680 family protein
LVTTVLCAVLSAGASLGQITPPAVAVAGERYEVVIPDTLDLADRAARALNALTGVLDPDRDYEIYFYAGFNPPVMRHEQTGMPTNNPKFAESLPMMRVMCGSGENLDVEADMMAAMLANIGDEGLYWARVGPERPWDPAKEDFANVYGNARMMLAMMAWYQRDGDPAWKERIDRMVAAFDEVAIRKGDMAYFPTEAWDSPRRVGEIFSYPRSGWTTTEDYADSGLQWRICNIHMYHGGIVRALARWHKMTGNEQALKLAGEIARYLTQRKMWVSEVEPRAVAGGERAHFSEHFHGCVSTLRGLLEYATAVHDPTLMQFVRDGYEYARNFGIAQIGFFPEMTAGGPCETCCTADMVALAIRLSDAGFGDYWDDVDQYVRNQLVEHQLLRADYLERIGGGAKAGPSSDPAVCTERVIERNLGAFTGRGNPTDLRDGAIMHCCTANGTQALYYAWEATVRCDEGTAKVNLLLNRASPWLDVDSYLPYEGKVVAHNKTATRLLLRVPPWADRSAVRVGVGSREVPAVWAGNYVLLDGLEPNDTVIVRFPIADRTTHLTWDGTTYAVTFRGNTVVDIAPRPEGAPYPIYERAQMRRGQAPMKRATRFVARRVMDW